MTTGFETPRVLPTLTEGGTVVCIATGPSLTPEDVEYCHDKAVVVVVNDAWTLAPWADVLYSGDRYWWAYHKGVPAFTGVKATIEYSPGRKASDLSKLAPDLIFLKQTGHNGVESKRDGIRTCGCNSGGQAVNLALHLGAKRIVLLGYDMGVPGSKRHFFGDHPRGLSNAHNFPRWRQAFDTMREPFEQLGITVLNASRSTSLNCFPCVSLEEALAGQEQTRCA